MATNIVILCADITIAQSVEAIAPPGLLPPISETMYSVSGQYAWIHWAFPADFLEDAIDLGAEAFEWTPDWKKEHGWVDPPPPPTEKA